MAAGLDELHPNQTEAIVLAFYGGFSYREVAVILGRAEGTIKGRIRTGLRKLQGTLAELVNPDPTGRTDSNDASPADSPRDADALIVALAQVQTEAELVERELHVAFDVRVALEQAKGVLPQRDDLSIREAFSRLHALARRDHVTLIESASGVVAASGAAQADDEKIDLTDATAEVEPSGRICGRSRPIDPAASDYRHAKTLHRLAEQLVCKSLSHRDIEDLLAAHALDAVDDDEARAVEAHLPSCDRCRGDLAGFRAVIALLPPRQ